MAEIKQTLRDDYDINQRFITARNPQANAMLERTHQTIGNMIRTFRIADAEIDEEDPFSGILSAVAFATRATVHTTLDATPSQLVFGRDPIIGTKHLADWSLIKDRKKKLIMQNNRKENKNRLEHDYKVGEKVLMKTDWNLKCNGDACKGPFTALQVNDNGKLRIQRGNVHDSINIRNVTPFHE